SPTAPAAEGSLTSHPPSTPRGRPPAPTPTKHTSAAHVTMRRHPEPLPRDARPTCVRVTPHILPGALRNHNPHEPWIEPHFTRVLHPRSTRAGPRLLPGRELPHSNREKA